MRKLILFAHTSLDGFMGGPDGQLDWIVWDEEVDQDFAPDLIQRTDTILTGRATYESFEASWPQRVADPHTPTLEREIGKWILETPIVVFTNTLNSFGLSNARRAERDIAAEVTALKAELGKDMVIYGGASTVQTLVAEGLIDEYWLKLTPTAIGTGLPVFSKLTDKLGLTPNWSKVYDSGVVGLRYAAAD